MRHQMKVINYDYYVTSPYPNDYLAYGHAIYLPLKYSISSDNCGKSLL